MSNDMLSPDEARSSISVLHHRNAEKYGDIELKRAINAIFNRLFPHRWIYIAELIQNAIDVGARSLRIAIDRNELIFEHDQAIFFENNVRGLCGVGNSTKGMATVGFMGVGFKSVFHRFQKAQIVSGPWSFALHVPYQIQRHLKTESRYRDWTNSLLPIWDDTAGQPSTGMTTRFVLSEPSHTDPLMGDLDHVFSLEANLLPLLARRGILKIDWNGKQWELHQRPHETEQTAVLGVAAWIIEARRPESSTSRKRWYLVERRYRPSSSAVQELIEQRQQTDMIDESRASAMEEEAARERSVEIFVEIDEDDYPRPPQQGRVFSVLPTSMTLPIGAHLQADWLLSLDREQAMNLDAKSCWHDEIREQIPVLICGFLALYSGAVCATKARAAALAVLPDFTMDTSTARWLLNEPFCRALSAGLASLPILPGLEHGLMVTPTAARFLPVQFQRLDIPVYRPEQLFGKTAIGPVRAGIPARAIQALEKLSLFKEIGIGDLANYWDDGQVIETWHEAMPEDKRTEALALLFSGLEQFIESGDEDELWEEISKLACIPMQDGRWMAASIVKRLPGDWDNLVPIKKLCDELVEQYVGKGDFWLLPWDVWKQMNPRQNDSIKADRERAFQFVNRIEVLDLAEDMLGLWWSGLPEVLTPELQEQVIKLTVMACKRRVRKWIQKVIVERSDKSLRLLSPSKTLLAHPYTGKHRRSFFPRIPQISGVYLTADRSISKNTWLDFFSSLQSAPKGEFAFRISVKRYDGWQQQEVQERFPNTNLDRRSKYLKCEIRGVGNITITNNEYVIVNHELPEEWQWQNGGKLKYETAVAATEWLNEAADHLLNHKNESLFFIRAYGNCPSPYAGAGAIWVEQLKNQAWVPDHDGDVYRPDEVLTKTDDARPQAPVARIPEELIDSLTNCGITFGALIPKAGALLRLRTSGAHADLDDLLEWLEEACDDAEDNPETAAQLTTILCEHAILPTDENGATRLVHGRFIQRRGREGILGGWLHEIRELPEDSVARAILDRVHAFRLFPETPTAGQSLDYLIEVWQHQPLAEQVRDVLPRAYAQVLKAIDEGDEKLDERWATSRRQAHVFVARPTRAWQPVGAAFLDDLGELGATLPAEILAAYPLATAGHLANDPDGQKNVAARLGLSLLSGRLKPEWHHRQPQALPELQAALQRIREFVARLKQRHADTADSEPVVDELVSLPAVMHVDRLELILRENGRECWRGERWANVLDGCLIVAGDALHYRLALASLLVSYWRLDQRGKLASIIGPLLDAADDPERLTCTFDALADMHGLSGDRSMPLSTENIERPEPDDTPADVTAIAADPDTGEPEPAIPPVQPDTGTGPVAPRPSGTPIGGTHGVQPAGQHRGTSGRDSRGQVPRTGDGRSGNGPPSPYTAVTADDRAARLYRQLTQLRAVQIEPADASDESPAVVREFGDDAAPRAFAMRYEREQGRHPEAMAFDQEGYDLESWSAPVGTPGRTLLRRVEIKGRGRPWQGAEIVALSAPQFRQAQADGDRYWLYVIAPGADGRPVLHALRDPAGRCRRHELRAVRWVPFIDEHWTAPADGGHLDFPDDLDDPDAAAGTGTP